MNSNELVEIKKGKTGKGLLIEHDGFISMSTGNNAILRESVLESNRDGLWKVPYPFIVDAIFQKFDIENANGRIYPEAILKKQVQLYIDTFVKNHTSTGQLDHPDTVTISGKEISHIIEELHWEGNTLVGKLRLITSEGFRKYGVISCLGDMAANLLLEDVTIGVSSRGVGSVENKFGKLIVGNDFELTCWDIVTQPSTPGAWIGKPEELQQFIESKETANKKLLDKLNKFQLLA